MNLYEVLGIDRQATAEQIKAAYRRKVKQCHPDAAGNDPAARMEFERVQRAYDILSSAEARASYDATGDDGMEVPAPHPGHWLVEVLTSGIHEGGMLDPSINPIRMLREVARHASATWAKRLARINELIAKLERLRAKIVYKGSGENLLGAAIEHQLEQPRKDARRATAMVEMIRNAIGLLDLYEMAKDSELSLTDLLNGMAEEYREEPLIDAPAPRRRRRAAV